MTQELSKTEQIVEKIREFVFCESDGRFWKEFLHLNGIIQVEGSVQFYTDGDFKNLHIEVLWSDNDDDSKVVRCHWIERLLEGRL